MLIVILAFSIALFSSVAKAKLVACVGNSNTYGALLPDRMNNCYPAQLEKLLQQIDPRWETQNFGVNGATVLRQGDTPYVNQGAYHQALASEPDVVILCFGPNGSRSPNRGYIQESYVSDYISLIDAFAALPSKPKIWICYPLKAFSGNYTISDAIIRNQIIPLITQIASEKHLPIIDFYTAFEDSPHLFLSDGIHPNPSGTKLMAEIISGVRANPDLNGDGVVDGADMCIVVAHWHTNEPSCDIAPPPFGDGMVDVQDLVVLAEHLFTYPGAVAYWKLDETEGAVAYDSGGDYDGTLMGGPVWQPDGGMAAGALQFDGIDDYVSTNPVLNPADGTFSVVAWIMGGAPGQAILSQADGVNWLSADPSGGNLMTELKRSGRGAGALLSQTAIADGDWHRVGFVWDGSDRILYVDDVEVARDTQTDLGSSEGGLYIGAGQALDPASFFSGLIDDVRMYNRVIHP